MPDAMLQGLDEFETRLRDIAAAQMNTSDSAHDLAHLLRVRANALRIALDERGVDREILLAAIWLHDAVNMEKSDPRRAEASRHSAAFARDRLSALMPPEKIEAVAHAIEAHSFSAGIPPRSMEARILRDADRLDAVGAIGIARCFYVSGRLHRALYDPADPWAAARDLDDGRFSLDHFFRKLLTLEADMLTEGGRILARQRTEFMRRYLDELRQEIAP